MKKSKMDDQANPVPVSPQVAALALIKALYPDEVKWKRLPNGLKALVLFGIEQRINNRADRLANGMMFLGTDKYFCIALVDGDTASNTPKVSLTVNLRTNELAMVVNSRTHQGPDKFIDALYLLMKASPEYGRMLKAEENEYGAVYRKNYIGPWRYQLVKAVLEWINFLTK